MMASSSTPAVFSPLETGNYRLVDRGAADNLPENLLQKAGIQTVISVDIGGRCCTPPGNSILKTAAHSFPIMSERLRVCGSNSEALLLKPPLLEEAGLFTFDQMMTCMGTGYQYMRRMIPETKTRLFKRG